MKVAVSNLRQGVFARASAVIAGTVLSVLSLSGVVIYPAMQLEDAEELLLVSEERAEQCRQQKAALRRLESSGGLEELRQARELVRSHLPGVPTEIELHSAARIAARSASVMLDNIRIGDKRDTDWPWLDRHVYAHGMALSGSASVSALIRFQEILEELGYPCSVSDFNFTRENVRSKAFEFRMTIDMYHIDKAPESSANEEFADFLKDMP